MGKKIKSKNNVPKNNRNALWIWLAIGGAILCIVNILLSCLFRGTDGSNIFTAISGWVSGVATLFIGIIAFLQNKIYVLSSSKRELKDSVRSEQSKIVVICDDLIRYSSIKKPLAILVDNNVTEKDLLAYGLEIDAMREKLISTSHLLQLFNYIPCNMGLLVAKITEMQIATYKQYQDAAKHYADDSLLGADIKNISEFTTAWVSDIMELCKSAIGELVKFSQDIDNAKSVVELQNILRVEDLQIVKARNDVKEIMQKTLNEEQNNG